MLSTINTQGKIILEIYNLKTKENRVYYKKNTVLDSGKSSLAKSLTNNVSSPYEFYINQMVFGSGGEDGNSQKTIDTSRTSLYYQTLAVNVSSSWDINYPTKALFVATITSGQINGTTVNEAGLVNQNGDLFSMVTFPGLSKTDEIQLTLNWEILFT